MALYFSSIDDEKVRCELCPHNCVLSHDQVGFCLTRKNENGVLKALNYGMVTSIALDPIEKKPLYHLNPGDRILSVGTFGCNLKCPFCQNWTISQEVAPARKITPEQLVSLAFARNSKGIAFTYNEPLVWFEFVLDTSRIAAKEGLYNVLVTNGMVSEEPLHLLLQSIHAMNVDLKVFDDKLYKKLAGDLETVKTTIKLAVENGVHVEVTTLVVPGFNDDENLFEKQVQWLASVDKTIPLHLTRYFPNYKYSVPPTPLEKLSEFRELAKKYLDFVYIGNVWEEGFEDTVCPSCGTLLVERKGYTVRVIALDKEGRCIKCGKKVVRII